MSFLPYIYLPLSQTVAHAASRGCRARPGCKRQPRQHGQLSFALKVRVSAEGPPCAMSSSTGPLAPRDLPWLLDCAFSVSVSAFFVFYCGHLFLVDFYLSLAPSFSCLRSVHLFSSSPLLLFALVTFLCFLALLFFSCAFSIYFLH